MRYKIIRANKPIRVYVDGGDSHVQNYATGEMFYNATNVGLYNFTLPAGYWKIWGKVRRVATMKAPKVKYPARERFYYKPKPFKIKTLSHNPMTASIIPATGLLIVGKAFRNLPDNEKRFILYHERGHYYYSSETKCDKYAANRMLKEGYNPSQIYLASVNTAKNADRHQCLFNHLQKK